MAKNYDNQWFRQLLEDSAQLESRLRRVNGILPAKNRCKLCWAPFDGPFAILMRLFHRHRSEKNADLCAWCEAVAREHKLGAEVELTLLFVDVRGSTEMASTLSPSQFREAMNRFFAVANRCLASHNAIVDKMVGDEAIGVFTPGLAGPKHARAALECAIKIVDQMKLVDYNGRRIRVGIGVNTGRVYFGHVGDSATSSSITAMGTEVNLTARLVGAASAGEILVAKTTAGLAPELMNGAAERVLSLKGVSEPVVAFSLIP